MSDSRRSSNTVQPLTLVELDLDWVLDAEVPAVNPDGTPCYRTPVTTASTIGPTAWRTLGVRTRRFCADTAPQVWSLDAIPCLREVRIETARLELGESLGAFGQVTLSLADFADDDRIEDPYFTERPPRSAGPGPGLRGSYFATLLARNPYVQGRALRVITRDVAHPERGEEVRHYLVRSLTRNAKGAWTLVGVSPLQLLNLRQAKVPKALGWRLAADLASTATTATLEAGSVAAPASATEPIAGLLRLGDELAAFTRAGLALTLVRGQFATAPADHEAGTPAQPVLQLQDATIPAILRTLLIDQAGIDAGFIPLTEWEQETAAWLAQYRLSPLPIVEPLAVTDLINELCLQVGLILWYDERRRILRLQALRPVPTHRVTTLRDDDLIGELGIATDLAKRISQVELFFARRSPLGAGDEPAGYRRRLLGESRGTSSAEHGGPAPLVIRSRWFASSDDLLAARTAATLLSQRVDGRTTYTITVSQRHAHLDLGDVVRLITRDLVDATGAPAPTYAFVIGRTPDRTGATIALTAERFPLVTRYAYAMPAGAEPYATTPEDLREPGWFLSATNGKMPDGTSGYALG